MLRFAFACLVACSAPQKQPVISPPPASAQLRAIVRIDPEPGGKGFQGVWLDFGGDKRWVIAYRAHGLWRSFENHEVVVTGHCYAPQGQAIAGQHFRVATMRFLTPVQGRGPLLEIGPARHLRGKFLAHAFPAGSKLANTTRITFADEAGKEYGIAGIDDDEAPVAGRFALVHAREVSPDRAYVAQPGGPSLWISRIRDPDDKPDGDPDPTMPCP